MSLYHFISYINESHLLSKTQDYDYREKRCIYKPDADSIIYQCPNCGRFYSLVNSHYYSSTKETLGLEIVEFLPDGVWFARKERLCGAKDCNYIAKRAERLPCGLHPKQWDVCHMRSCHLKEKCVVYK